MRNFITDMKKKTKNMRVKAMCKVQKARKILAGNAGENYVDSAVIS